MTSRTYTCARCDRQMRQPEAFINDQAYCHSDDGPDCYKLTQWEVVLETGCVPTRIIVGIEPGTAQEQDANGHHRPIPHGRI